ncbi:hypothetical protein IV203_019283 [Nitzschia inconspicua]|uniref:Uncharacterized protein n=1 Tax=Nitzschia inconspicua TaxID=303405 RepID=A0A9K3LZ46_9STRA|nr:hypothetical protein IV203_019283 [Nitzschia inconspicua]
MMDMKSEPTAVNNDEKSTTTANPRLADIEMQDGGEEEEDPKRRSMFEARRTTFTRIIQGGAIAAIVVNILAMALEWSWIMFFAGLCGVALGGGVIYYQKELRGEDTLRTVHNDLRHKVNDFSQENEKLTGTVTQLQGEVTQLKETEKKLDKLAREQGVTVAKLSDLVKTNKQTLALMKANLEADVLASMMDVVLNADRCEDNTFTDRGIQGMILRLKMLPTIEMDEARFKAKLETIKEEKRQISAIFNLMQQISQKDVSEEDRVFKLSDNAMDRV